MSFGEGNKRERIAELEERLAQAKRSLGGTQAANNRLKGEISTLKEYNAALQDKVDSLKDTNGELCKEINRQERRIRELEALVRDIWRVTSAECPPCDVCGVETDDGECGFIERMRALGIEEGDES